MGTPIGQSARIISLDILRGFALLGILIINIQSFAMPGAAYLNPSAWGDLTGINKAVWIASHVLADSKMMAIFSILFGAGIILIIEKASTKGRSGRSLHLKRMFWLLLFGLIHAHLIWYGDILVAYAICGVIAYMFHKKTPKTLIIIGFIFIAIHTLIYTFFGLSIAHIPEDQLVEMMADWAPSMDTMIEEISLVTGSLGDQIAHNSESATMLETFVFFILFLWRATGLMLIGMALYKSGVLSAQRSTSFYKKGWLWAWFIGFPIVLLGVYQNFAQDWTYTYSMFIGSQPNYWGSLGVSFGYICLLMLMIQKGTFRGLQDRLASAGQMAFTNYISQSLICVFIFWGAGLGLFGQMDRWQQILVVFGVWTLQLLWSKPWLERYKFGPLEWLWRSLTYGQFQKMKK